jgi:hypothetical protein
LEFVARAHVDGIPHRCGTSVLAITRGIPQICGSVYDGIVRIWAILPVIPGPIGGAALRETVTHNSGYRVRVRGKIGQNVQSIKGKPIEIIVSFMGLDGQTQGIKMPISIGTVRIPFSGTAREPEQALHVIQQGPLEPITGFTR